MKFLIKKILKILNLNNSVFHMEFFNNKNEWYFSECGARIGGGLSNDLFESALGISLSEILAKLVQYKNIDFKFVPSDLTYSYTYIQPFKKQIKTLPSESKLKNQIKNIIKVIYEWKPGDDLIDSSQNSVKRTGMILLKAKNEKEIKQAIDDIYEYFDKWETRN